MPGLKQNIKIKYKKNIKLNNVFILAKNSILKIKKYIAQQQQKQNNLSFFLLFLIIIKKYENKKIWL